MRRKFAVTSDWHIGHGNCLRFDNRPFSDLDHMHSVLANNINSSLGKNDILYVLGDVGICKDEHISKFMSRLGDFTKVLVKGNHDKEATAMMERGFDLVVDVIRLHIMDTNIWLTHCPPNGIKRENTMDYARHNGTEDFHGQPKNQRYCVDYNVNDLFLHGHIHSRNDKNPDQDFNQPKYKNLWDIGVPANNYRPIMQSEIESHIAKLKKEKNE